MVALVLSLVVPCAAHEGAEDVGIPPDPALGIGQFAAVRGHVHAWVDFTALASGATRGNDVWGYVSPSGREYAFAGFDSVTAVVDVTDPDVPLLVAELDHPDSNWSDVKTFREHAYLSNQASGGVQVFDLGQIDAGVITELAPIDLGGLHVNAHTLALDETSGFLYTAGGDYAAGGIVVYDLTDPANPLYVAEWQTNYVHALQVHTWTSGPDAGRQLAYVCGGTTGFEVVDVTDKANLQHLATVDYGPAGYTHQGWLDPVNALFYVDDEGDERQAVVPTTTTWVIDVSDPATPYVASTFTNGNTAIDHNLMVTGGAIYEANYTSGLRVFDAGPDPLQPVEVGWVDTYPFDDAETYAGAWGVYVLPSGIVLVQDIQAGLFVIGVEDALTTAPDAFALLAPADGAFVAPWRAALSWERPWGAWEQTLTLATDAALTLGVIESPLPSDATSAPVSALGLAECTTWWWTVRAINGSGETTATTPWTFQTGPIGDLNGNGVVNHVDRNAHNQMILTQNLAGDFDANGVVDLADRAILAANLGGC